MITIIIIIEKRKIECWPGREEECGWGVEWEWREKEEAKVRV